MGAELVDVRTGELVDVTSAEDTFLAGYLRHLREAEGQAREVKKMITEELLRRMDVAASWTRRAGAYEIKGVAPGGVDYQPELLRANLEPFVQEGTIDPDALNRAVEVVEELKVRKAGVKALLKLGNEELERAIELSEVPAKSRSVSVSEG